MKNKITIWFTDFWSGFDYKKNTFASHIVQIISSQYDVELDEKNPDFLFYSSFGFNHIRYSTSVRIFVCGETVIPDFNVCDYAISQIKLEFDERNLNFPFMLWIDLGAKAGRLPQDVALNRKFCSFIYSNSNFGEGSLIRTEFCKKLGNEYKYVHCPGIVLHNCDAPELSKRNDNGWVHSKRHYMAGFKFNIAYENTMVPGYITEKLADCFISGVVPIYRGSNLPSELKEAVICADDYPTFDSLIERVKEVDNNDALYMSILNANHAFGEYSMRMYQKLDDFIMSIIEKGRHPREKNNPYDHISKYLPLAMLLMRIIRYTKRILLWR